MSDTQKPKSYTSRMIDFLTENKVNKKTIDLIKQFASDEAEKRNEEKEATKGVINFGKFRGKQLSKIYEIEPTYIKWLDRNNQFLSEQNREIVKELLNSE